MCSSLTDPIASRPEWSLARSAIQGHITVPRNLRLCRRPAHKGTRPASDRPTGGDLHPPNARRWHLHRSTDPARTRVQSRAAHRALPPRRLLPREPSQTDHICSAPRTALRCLRPMPHVPLRTGASISDRRLRRLGRTEMGCEPRL